MPPNRQLKFFTPENTFKIAKEEFTYLMADKTLKSIIQLILLLMGLHIIGLAFFWTKLPPQLPLFYSRPWGESQLVERNYFLILPISTFILSLINLRLASILFKRELLISQVLVWSSLLINLLAGITLYNILKIIL